jgi:hypothetical protein
VQRGNAISFVERKLLSIESRMMGAAPPTRSLR